MIRIERECKKCQAKRWLGDFEVQKYDVFHARIPQEHCTICRNRGEFDIVLTVLKQEKKEDDLSI